MSNVVTAGFARDGVGRIQTAAVLGRGTIALFGWHLDRLPRRGAASLAGAQSQGRFRLVAWPRQEGGVWFLAAAQLPAPTAGAGRLLMLHGPGLPERALAPLPRQVTDVAALASDVAAHAAGHGATVVRFLLDLLAAGAGPAVAAFLTEFVPVAATEDGVIEIVGINRDALVLQGWGQPTVADAQALVLSPQPSLAPLLGASFPRADIPSPATGLLELTACPATALGEWLVVLSGADLRRRRLLPQRTMLGAAETVAHLAQMQPRLLPRCPASQAALRHALRPVFSGIDTVSALAVPVRAALDLVAVQPGGVFLAGWLLDPLELVASVSLGAAGGVTTRLDGGWSRVHRPDVAREFQADHRFAEAPEESGFAAFATPAPPAQASLFLQLELRDGTVAYLPARPARGTPLALRRRALQSVDLHKPCAHAVIARQMVPLLRARLTPAPAERLRDGAPGGRTALLLAMPAPDQPASVSLSPFLRDPLVTEERLVIVVSPAWQGAALAALLATLDLYRLDATVLRAAEPMPGIEALEIGAGATDAARFICLPSEVAGPPGWRRSLAAALPADALPVVLFPTALHEDGSVRSTGVERLESLPSPPWIRVVRPLAGRPASGVAIPDRGPLPRLAGSLAGAVVTRAAHREASGFAGGAATAPGQELAFFQRLAASGGSALWHPGVSVVAPEPAVAQRGWHEVASLAEALLLRGDPASSRRKVAA